MMAFHQNCTQTQEVDFNVLLLTYLSSSVLASEVLVFGKNLNACFHWQHLKSNCFFLMSQLLLVTAPVRVGELKKLCHAYDWPVFPHSLSCPPVPSTSGVVLKPGSGHRSPLVVPLPLWLPNGFPGCLNCHPVTEGQLMTELFCECRLLSAVALKLPRPAVVLCLCLAGWFSNVSSRENIFSRNI